MPEAIPGTQMGLLRAMMKIADKGQIFERGMHEELIALNGSFTKLDELWFLGEV